MDKKENNELKPEEVADFLGHFCLSVLLGFLTFILGSFIIFLKEDMSNIFFTAIIRIIANLILGIYASTGIYYEKMKHKSELSMNLGPFKSYIIGLTLAVNLIISIFYYERISYFVVIIIYILFEIRLLYLTCKEYKEINFDFFNSVNLFSIEFLILFCMFRKNYFYPFWILKVAFGLYCYYLSFKFMNSGFSMVDCGKFIELTNESVKIELGLKFFWHLYKSIYLIETKKIKN